MAEAVAVLLLVSVLFFSVLLLLLLLLLLLPLLLLVLLVLAIAFATYSNAVHSRCAFAPTSNRRRESFNPPVPLPSNRAHARQHDTTVAPVGAMVEAPPVPHPLSQALYCCNGTVPLVPCLNPPPEENGRM